jgi:hypothetical protein
MKEPSLPHGLSYEEFMTMPAQLLSCYVGFQTDMLFL